MFMVTRALREAVAHATPRAYTPSITFLGRRSWPAPDAVDNSRHPHPASPSGAIPQDWPSPSAYTANSVSSHSSFSSYRDHAQQHGPLQRTIRPAGPAGIGGTSGASLGPVTPPKGIFFDRSELGARFARKPFSIREIEAVESGGAAMWG